MIKFRELLFLKSLKRVGKATIYKKYWDILNDCRNLDELISQIEKDSKFTKDDVDNAIKKSEKLYDDANNDKEIQVITVFDDNYPEKLKVMANKRPLILYVKGNVEALTKPNLAVIGTRKPSKNSQEFEKDFVKKILNDYDDVIVSGLALGCDKIAHSVTVDESKITIAILPGGFNHIAPVSNKKLADEIISNNGCLITEYEPNTKVFRGNYVERDRIMAAFCDVAIVIECGVKSGTMHTVDAALKYEKELFAYLPDDISLGDYSGNIKILNENTEAIRIIDINDYFDRKNFSKSSKQQSLDYFK